MMKLIQFELDKLLNRKSTIGALLAIILILLGIFYIGFYYSHIGLVNRNNSVKGFPDIYWEKSQKFEGDLTDERVSDLLSDYMRDYQDLPVEERPFDLFSSNIADVFVSSDQEDIYIRMNEAMESGNPVTIEDVRLNTLSEVGFKTFSKPLKMGSYLTWSDLFAVSGIVFLLASIIAIIINSDIFSGDVSKNIDNLLRTTKLGKTSLPRAKISAGLFLSVGVFWVLQAITMIVFSIYNRGWSGWDVSIQANFVLKNFSFSSNINQLQTVIVMFLFYTVAIMATSSLSLLLSALNKTTVVSLLLGIGIFLLPLSLTQIFREGIIHQILYLLPVNNYRVEQFLTVFDKGNGLLPFTFLVNVGVVCALLLVTTGFINRIIFKKIKGLS